MDHHNDMRAMVKEIPEDKPSFYLLNVGETHYPYALLTNLRRLAAHQRDSRCLNTSTTRSSAAN